ncbi:MAG: LptF/LptG family permease [Myxococcota bacterium]
MRLVRYFAAVCAASVTVVWVTLIVLVIAVSLVENAGNLTRLDAGAMTALRLSVYSAVSEGYQVLPIATFLGVLVAGTLLARRGELLAAQAAGITPQRPYVAFFLVALTAATVGGAIGELAVPRALAALERVQLEELGRADGLTRFYNRRLQYFRYGALILYLPHVDTASAVFYDPVIYHLEAGLIDVIIEAKRMVYEHGTWALEDATRREVASTKVESLPRLDLPLTIEPRSLTDLAGDPRQMASPEVAALVRRRREAGFDATAHRLELHSRLAYPLSVLWLFVLAAPWALHPERRRSLVVSLGAGVVAVALELSLSQVFRLLALGRKIPAPMGSWAIGIVSVCAVPVSYWLYDRYRTRGSVW